MMMTQTLSTHNNNKEWDGEQTKKGKKKKSRNAAGGGGYKKLYTTDEKDTHIINCLLPKEFNSFQHNPFRGLLLQCD